MTNDTRVLALAKQSNPDDVAGPTDDCFEPTSRGRATGDARHSRPLAAAAHMRMPVAGHIRMQVPAHRRKEPARTDVRHKSRPGATTLRARKSTSSRPGEFCF